MFTIHIPTVPALMHFFKSPMKLYYGALGTCKMRECHEWQVGNKLEESSYGLFECTGSSNMN